MEAQKLSKYGNNFTTLQYTTLQLNFFTPHYTRLYSLHHYTTLRYTTLHYTLLHYTTLHYANYIAPQLQLQLQLHYTNYTMLQLQLHCTTLQLQLELHYTTLHPVAMGEVTTATTAKSTTPITFRSISSLCHSCISTSPIASYL